MSLNEWLRSMFKGGETSEPRSGRTQHKTEEYDNIQEEEYCFYENSDDCYDNKDQQPGQNPRFPFDHSGDAKDMFRHFDGMFRDFDEMFRSMGITEFPRASPDIPGIEDRSSDWGSWRDLLRKPEDKQDENMQKENHKNRSPGFRSPSFFGNMWMPNHDRIEPKFDRDLDKEFEKGDLSKLIVPFEKMPPAGSSGQPRQFRALSVQTIRGADGRVEERRTRQDADGNTETTVTRRLGDQEQTITTKRSPDGSEELSETTVNLDKNDKENFERRWNMASLPGAHQESQHQALVPGQSQLDTKKDSIFYNLFGSSFKGFPPSKKD